MLDALLDKISNNSLDCDVIVTAVGVVGTGGGGCVLDLRHSMCSAQSRHKHNSRIKNGGVYYAGLVSSIASAVVCTGCTIFGANRTASQIFVGFFFAYCATFG